eukprot:COSAG03_NODE_982_length_5115_cov_9.263357_1_plen_148_part_00
MHGFTACIEFIYYTAAGAMHAPGRRPRARRCMGGPAVALMPCTHLDYVHAGGGDWEFLGRGVLHLDQLLVYADHDQLLLGPRIVPAQRTVDKQCVIAANSPSFTRRCISGSSSRACVAACSASGLSCRPWASICRSVSTAVVRSLLC